MGVAVYRNIGAWAYKCMTVWMWLYMWVCMEGVRFHRHAFQIHAHAVALLQITAHLYSTSRTALRWLPMSVAVLERWLFNRDANVGHYITSDLSRWL